MIFLKYRQAFAFSLLLIAGCATVPVSSVPGPRPQVVEQAHTKVQLVSDVQKIAAGRSFSVAVHMKMDPEWHVYWRNPGDSGLAPVIKWQLPPGFTAGPIQWPYPHRIQSGDLTTFGYEDEVLLMSEILPPAELGNGPVEIKADVSWLACRVPCIPGKAQLTLQLEVSKGSALYDSRWQKIFLETKKKLPRPVSNERVEVKENSEDYELRVSGVSNGPVRHAEFFPHDDKLLLNPGKQNFRLSPDQKSFSLTLQKDKSFGRQLTRYLEGVLVVSFKDRPAQALLIKSSTRVSRDFARDLEYVEGLPSLRDSPVLADVLRQAQDGERGRTTAGGRALPFGSPASAGKTLGIMLFFSFFGGMILNLMPCVFPVLSIKALTFIKHSQNRKMLWLSVGGYTFGVVAAFLLFAGALIVLRQAGQAVGWGFQFQSPYFVAGMAAFLFLMALNLLGVFEWSWISRGSPYFLNHRVKKMGAAPAYPILEALGTGVLATVVATPCTAPFMGAAMSFAITQSAVVNLLIFAFLGLGMAFPFVVLCFFPSLVKKLPRPGPWMNNFKKWMALPLLVTVAWLLWVLAGQVNVPGVEQRTGLQKKTGQVQWLSYDEVLVRKNIEDGKIVFIDFTARWCLTCQVNKKLALENREVVELFLKRGVVAVKADWTNNDESITRALARYGKNSVPVYVFLYQAGGRTEEKILPELLTPAIVKEALNAILEP